MNTGYRKRVIALLFFLLLSRFWFCQTFELTGQEAYVWMKSLHLDWGYWDQGPLVPWAAWLGTKLFGPTELGVRWITANLYACVGFLLFISARTWFNPRIGLYAVLFYISLPLYNWNLLLLSETTLSVGLMGLALFAFQRVLLTQSWFWWVSSGFLVGLATMLCWWNWLWMLGFFFFLLVDPRRESRLLTLQSGAMLGTSILGFLPFLTWHLQNQTLSTLTLTNWPMLVAHQNPLSNLSFYGFVRDQSIWLGFLALPALGFCLLKVRSFPHLFREHHFFCFLAAPGLLLQFALSFWGAANQEVVPALILPLIILCASVAARLHDQDKVWRPISLTVLLCAATLSLCGFFPQIAKKWPAGYAPAPRKSAHTVATEVARWTREIGATFIVADSPQTASLMSFYLPFQPFVYTVANQGVDSQYDFWSTYFDFNGANSVFVMVQTGSPPGELFREFETVKKISEAQIPGQTRVSLYSCYHYGR